MKFITSLYTDIGIRKKTNQDSMLIMQASTSKGPVVLASVCDGMGGLAKGEAASASMINALVKWFSQNFPKLLSQGLPEQELWNQWNDLTVNTSRLIENYGIDHNINLGTTCTAILITSTEYYTMNVGDSRIYLITDDIHQLTKDQSFVQREIDAGRMTQEQALIDTRRNILLQCIGASHIVKPAFGKGTTGTNQVFMLCSDGCRHMVTAQEFYQAFNPSEITTKALMEQKIKNITDLNISRGEDDNISAILIRTYK